MIIDSLKNISLYEKTNPNFKFVFEYIKNTNLNELEAGKTHLGNDINLIVEDRGLKLLKDAKLEAHQKYIDIQIPLNNVEGFGWKQAVECEENAPFDHERDIVFYKTEPSFYFSLKPGEFAIFFPEDAHAPCIGDGAIKKIIFKVPA